MKGAFAFGPFKGIVLENKVTYLSFPKGDKKGYAFRNVEILKAFLSLGLDLKKEKLFLSEASTKVLKYLLSQGIYKRYWESPLEFIKAADLQDTKYADKHELFAVNPSLEKLRYIASQVDLDLFKEGINMALVRCSALGKYPELKYLISVGADINFEKEGNDWFAADRKIANFQLYRFFILQGARNLQLWDIVNFYFKKTYAAQKQELLSCLKYGLFLENKGLDGIKDNIEFYPLIFPKAKIFKYLLLPDEERNKATLRFIKALITKDAIKKL